MYSVYKVTNKLNGKMYIGFSSKPISRWSEHRKPGFKGRMLTDAIHTDGVENFEFAIIVETDSKDFARNLETELIISHNTKFPNGYNRLVPGLGKAEPYISPFTKKEETTEEV